jgi:glycerol-1-phosphate dehydrogenase [NAD(P)+]
MLSTQLPEGFIIQSHRGAGVLAPENTLEAFEYGWSLGCWPECDVRTTRNGVIVTHHDPIPTDAEESKLCQLRDVLARMNGNPQRHLYLDVKEAELEQLAQLVREHRVEPQIVFSSTQHEQLLQWKRLLPDSQTLLWMGGNEAELQSRIDLLRQENFAEITQLQVHLHVKPELVPSEKFLKELAKQMQARGILFQVLPYFPAGTAMYRRLLDLGVESFATDHPDQTIHAVHDYFFASVAVADAQETREIEITPGGIDRVAAIFARHFPNRDPLIVADRNTYPLVGERLRHQLKDARDAFVFQDADLYAGWCFFERLESRLRSYGKSVIPVAVGSGTINDLTKLAAHRTNRSYIAVATAASMDGYAAFGASITRDGIKQTFECPAPRAVVADLDVLCGAPREMSAAGFADLLAKITAGADWILADALGIEPIDPRAWSLVQDHLREWLSDPAGVARGDTAAIRRLTVGLIQSGLAMQTARSSRPASGAEHQFSHLWDMEHHTHNGVAPSHGFKVGVATVAVAELYERLLAMPMEQLNVEQMLSNWHDWPDDARRIGELFPESQLRKTALKESAAKHVDRDQLRRRLQHLKDLWPVLTSRLEQQLIPCHQLRKMLGAAGAAINAADIEISAARLAESVAKARRIRRRYTALDLAHSVGLIP